MMLSPSFADPFARLILDRQRLDAEGDGAVVRKFRLPAAGDVGDDMTRNGELGFWQTPRDAFGQGGRVVPGDTQLQLMPLTDEGQRPPFDRSKGIYPLETCKRIDYIMGHEQDCPHTPPVSGPLSDRG